MIVYCIRDDGAPRYYASKTEAYREAREATASIDLDRVVEVERVTLVKFDKETIIRVINQQGGYVESSESIATFQKGRRIR
jgi:hypothetical protein